MRFKVLSVTLGVLALPAAALAGRPTPQVVLTVDITTPTAVVVSSTGAAATSTISGTNFNVGLPGAVVSAPVFIWAMPGTLASTQGQMFYSGLFYDGGLLRMARGGGQTQTFTAGVSAFSGSMTGDLSDVTFAPAGTVGDITVYNNFGDPTGVVIGQYQIIPTPGAAGLLAIGGLIAARRRR